MVSITCASCGEDIVPGQSRKPTEEGTKHEYCVLHDSLFDKYVFQILNPSNDKGYSVGFWRVYEDGTEFNIVNYSTNELVTVGSASSLFSRSAHIKPTEEFFITISHTVHTIMSFNPFPMPSYMRIIDDDKLIEEVDRHTNIFYDNKPPEHEKKVIKAVVAQILPHSFPHVIPELKPIRDFAQESTQFSLPDVHPELADPE